jgi:uncharacterized membrane protein YkvA (DUF1232 family)
MWLAVSTGVLVLVALSLALYLHLAGHREAARALAGVVPDFVVLTTRLLRDRRVSFGRKLLLAGLLGYLVSPVDLLPGSPLEDALLAMLVFRLVLRGQGKLIDEHWPGPPGSLALVRRMAGRGVVREPSGRPQG